MATSVQSQAPTDGAQIGRVSHHRWGKTGATQRRILDDPRRAFENRRDVTPIVDATIGWIDRLIA
jgi:hypothetical protein